MALVDLLIGVLGIRTTTSFAFSSPNPHMGLFSSRLSRIKPRTFPLATTTLAMTSDAVEASLLERRVRHALWCFFAGDALASPTHWYYGGFGQVQRDYGPQGITDYTQPVYELPGSILNKSNLNGGGRAVTGHNTGSSSSKTIVGEVILHGKQDLWDPYKSIHYHATLQAGENTLEATLGRVLLRTLTQNHGRYDAQTFRQAYMDFMKSPGSHNDTYASTCHRMFFANLKFRNKPPAECPDDDGHNVLAVDGLVLPTVAALATIASGGTVAQASQAAADCAATTRNSVVLERSAAAWGGFVARALLRPAHDSDNDHDEDSLEQNVRQVGRELGLSLARKPRNTMTACYLQDAFPALLDNVRLWKNVPVWEALLKNANTGGENVHRGSCLGAALGLYSDQGIPDHLRTGLYHFQEIEREIDAFVAATVGDRQCHQEQVFK